MNILKNALCLMLVSASFACSSSGDAVDIGTSRTGQKLEDYADSWVGYVEAYKFADGSDKVRITLDASGNGTVEIGDSAALPAATDPDVGYPEAGVAADVTLGLRPGASYPIKAATVESGRIQLSVNQWDLWADWCSLQTSYPTSTPGHYSVLPSDVDVSGNDTNCSVGNPPQAIDCGKLQTSSLASCSCTASSCTALEGASPNDYTQLDGALADAGESLVGTLVLAPSYDGIQRVNVRLTRQ